LWRWLPRGSTLPDEAWAQRHRAILVLLWLHVPLIFLLSLTEHLGVLHSLTEAVVVAVLAGGATAERARRQLSTVVAAIGLMTCSAILVHVSGGVIEMHFHYFVMVAVVTLYQDWKPFLIAISFVVLQHGVIGVLAPSAVYDHQAAIDHPWQWAGVHGLFILGMSAAGIASWRFNESLLDAAEDREERLSEAQDLARLGSWEWDLASGLTWSPELYRLFGVDAGELNPSPEDFLPGVHPEDRDAVDGEIRRTLEAGTPYAVDCRLLLPGGTVRWVHARGAVTIREDGRPTVMSGTVQDITDRKRAEAELRDLSELKDAFVRTVSHDLRTPLSVISGMAQLLQETDPPNDADSQRGIAERIEANAARLNRLVANLLDFDRAAHGRLAPNRKPTDVSAVVRDVVAVVEVGDHPLRVESEPALASVDTDQIERMVENLVANGVRHTPEGTPIWVRVGRRPDGVLITVDDAGAGVPDALKRTIFEPYHRDEASGGTGIGLSLVVRFAELHGGRAWVEDRPGGGASFRVLVPYEGAEFSTDPGATRALGVAG
jgi:PAS domain S-box-containing protein